QRPPANSKNITPKSNNANNSNNHRGAIINPKNSSYSSNPIRPKKYNREKARAQSTLITELTKLESKRQIGSGGVEKIPNAKNPLPIQTQKQA
ncbi:hypothetical protein GIB67_020643, partial [Kingdonia uniflora]